MRTNFSRLILAVIFGLCCIIIGFALLFARIVEFPTWYDHSLVGKSFTECSNDRKQIHLYCNEPKEDLNLNYKEIATDHVYGWWIDSLNRPAKGTIILVHGAGYDRRAMLKHATYLVQNGYHVLLIDSPNHGLFLKDDHGVSFGYEESKNIYDVVQWLASENYQQPIIIFGTSQGAFSALLAAKETPLIRAVIAESPYLSVEKLFLDYPNLKWIPALSKKLALVILGLKFKTNFYNLNLQHTFGPEFETPVLLIHGEEDQRIPQENSRWIYEELSKTQAHAASELWIVPHGHHEQLWNRDQKSFQDHVLEFLNKITKNAP